MRPVFPRHLICLLGLLLPLAGGCDTENKDRCEIDGCIAESETEGETEDETEGEETKGEETKGGETEGEETEGEETEDGETEGGETEGETDGDTEATEGEETEGETDSVDCENGVCEGDPCEVANDTVACGDGGLRYCSRSYEDGSRTWGRCVMGDAQCELGEEKSCGNDDEDIFMSCDAIDGEPRWDWEDCNTPLVLAFDNEPIALTASAGSFDIAGNGCISTDWPTAATPWLALDRDRNGSIDGGHELFGNGTVLSGGDEGRAWVCRPQCPRQQPRWQHYPR